MVLARERFGHDAVRAQLDLPDFFENLAGNHLLKQLIQEVEVYLRTELFVSSNFVTCLVSKSIFKVILK
jgi:hypothetical protein